MSVEVLEDAPMLSLSEPFTVSAGLDGIFRFKLACTFVGTGRIAIRDPLAAPAAPPLSELPLRCYPGSGPEPAPSAAAAAPEADPAPPGIPGRIEALSNKSRFSSDDEDVITFASGDSRTFTTTRSGFLETTLSGGQRCQTQSVTGERCCFSSNPDDPGCLNECRPLDSEFTVCESAPLLPTMEDLTVAGANDFSLSRTTTTASSTTDETTQSQSGTEWTITWVFPDVAPDLQIEAVDVLARPVRPLNALDVTGIDQFVMLDDEMNVAFPTPTGPLVPVSPAACPGTRFRTSGLQWRLPGPTERAITTTMIAGAGGCTITTDLSGGSGGTQITGSQTQSFSTMIQPSVAAETATAPLMLVPAASGVAPTNRRFTDPNVLGQSSTALRAVLSDVPPGTYEIAVEIVDFDEESGGHRHGDPPGVFWGRLVKEEDLPLDVTPAVEDLEESCEIQVETPDSTNLCEVFFQSDEVAGLPRFRATTTVSGLEVSASATVEVLVEGLSDFRNAAGSSGGFLRAADPAHPDDVAFFMSAATSGHVLAMMGDFTELTESQQHPDGLALLLNDVSLRWGGLFDVAAGWTPPHRGHRDGTGVDINSRGVELAKVGDFTADDLILLPRSLIQDSCERNRGRLISEATIHCEF